MFKILAIFLFLALVGSVLSCEKNKDCGKGEVCDKDGDCVEPEDDKHETTTTEKEEEDDEDTESKGKKGKDCDGNTNFECFSKYDKMLECKAKKCVKSDWMLCISLDDCEVKNKTKIDCFNNQCIDPEAKKCPNDEYCKHIDKNKECQNGKCVLSNRHKGKELSKGQDEKGKKGSKDMKTKCKSPKDCTIEGVVQDCIKGLCVIKDKDKDKKHNDDREKNEQFYECKMKNVILKVRFNINDCCVGDDCGEDILKHILNKPSKIECTAWSAEVAPFAGPLKNVNKQKYQTENCEIITDKINCVNNNDCKNNKKYKKCSKNMCYL